MITETTTVVSTGCNSIDQASGIGGLPFGRLVEIYGGAKSGTTTIALQTAAKVQAMGGTAAIVDVAGKLDLQYAHGLGVDVSRLLVSQPDCAEQALEIALLLADSKEVDLVIIDGAEEMTPRLWVEGRREDDANGLRAMHEVNGFIRKLHTASVRRNVLVVFTNKTRGDVPGATGNPAYSASSNGLKFYTSIRLEVRRLDDDRRRVHVRKNKLASPFAQAEFNIEAGRGTVELTEAE